MKTATATNSIDSLKNTMFENIGVADRIAVADSGKAAQFDFYETRAFGGDIANINQRIGGEWTMVVRAVVEDGRMGLRFTFTR